MTTNTDCLLYTCSDHLILLRFHISGQELRHIARRDIKLLPAPVVEFELSHMDEFIDSLLREDRVCDCILPRVQKRTVLEENNELDPRVSALDDDMDDIESSDEEGEVRVGGAGLLCTV